MDILNVTIVRSPHLHMNREVLDYEYPVIQQTFGEGLVQIAAERQATKEDVAKFLRRPVGDDGKLDMRSSDAELAWNQMQARYNGEGSPKDAREAFHIVYPSFHQFKRAFGKPN